MGALLDELGLDTKTWITNLKKIGITSKKQLQHADKNEYGMLCKFVKHTWEQNALKKLIIYDFGKHEAKQVKEIGKLEKSASAQYDKLKKDIPKDDSVNFQFPSDRLMKGNILLSFLFL